jgi:hypothetical protein
LDCTEGAPVLKDILENKFIMQFGHKNKMRNNQKEKGILNLI